MQADVHPKCESFLDGSNPRALAIRSLAALDPNRDIYTLAIVGELNLPKLRCDRPDLEIFVTDALLDSLKAGTAEVSLTVPKEGDAPFIALSGFTGSLIIDFKDSDSAFVMGHCQNFSFKALMYANSFISIGRATSCNSCSATVSDAVIVLGSDCMLSHGIILQPSDQHDIIDIDTGMVINQKRSIVIDRHVWIGKEAYIGAGVTIGKDSIVGARSVVAASVPEATIVAGNPAKAVKSGISWTRRFTRSASNEQ
ncbi:acyltransferase [Sphingomonas sp. VDB2]|uniref:acyltransferase n=1 Tax=Sphingomonas sp. VDB2 TaxID=3228751 RepID=UPI003A8024D9